MKYILYSCDCCGKTHPTAAPKGWWGINNPTAAVPVFSFQPLTKHDKTEYPKHMCSLECLQNTIKAVSEVVDIKKVRAAKPAAENYSSLMNSMFFPRSIFKEDDSDVHDSTGTYKKEAEDEEDAE